MHRAAPVKKPDSGTSLAGRVAVVTGGGRGLGRLLAGQLAGAGAAVGLIARSPDELAATVTEITQAGGTAAAAAADVTDHQAAAAALVTLRRRLGAADILVNNAGVSGPVAPLWQADPAQWWHAIEVNLGGAFALMRMMLPDMVAAGYGRVINITSYAGVHRWPLVSAYAAAKAALVKLTETLAEEVRPHGVSVFSVDPGLLPLGLSDVATSSTAGPDTPEGRVFGWIRGELAAGRGSDPRQAGRLIVSLASGHADVLSGRHLSVRDDLAELLQQIDAIRRNDLHTLRLRTGADGGQRNRAGTSVTTTTRRSR
jgi:NAD(P)-dependent dehydrogenase (short-subunit alcohol dehydrogenase family)